MYKVICLFGQDLATKPHLQHKMCLISKILWVPFHYIRTPSFFPSAFSTMSFFFFSHCTGSGGQRAHPCLVLRIVGLHYVRRITVNGRVRATYNEAAARWSNQDQTIEAEGPSNNHQRHLRNTWHHPIHAI